MDYILIRNGTGWKLKLFPKYNGEIYYFNKKIDALAVVQTLGLHLSEEDILIAA